METLKLIQKDGKYESTINIKSEKVMLQIIGATTLDLLISVDGIVFVPHTSAIEIADNDVINLTNCKFLSFLKITSTNNVVIKILD